MRVHLTGLGGGPTRIPGPADLAGRTRGTAVITGPATDDEVSWWGIALGLFAARGGEVRWSTTR